MARKRKKSKKQKVVNLQALKQINLAAAGLDIGAAEIYAAVPEDRDSRSVRSFQTYTRSLHALADWLLSCGIDTVAMESTGVYWIPIYEILDQRGFEVLLVNARHIKNVPGRKTDVLDCQWIQQLHTYGLLQGSFRPADHICALRALVRHRDMLIRYRSSHVQHMQKALHMMNVQLTNVLSDVTGVTGMKIIRGIVSGDHNPTKLAQYRDYRCHKSKEEIALALEGNYRTEHLFALKHALELYDLYSQKIKDCDFEIETMYSTFEPQVDIVEKPLKNPKAKKPRGNEPDFDLRLYLYQMAGVDLTHIPGVNALTAQTILSEIGLDMSKWKTGKHFSSWLSVCPYNDVTGGKTIKSGTKKSQNRAAKALRMAAHSLSRSDSYLGAFFRRIKARSDAPTAITATAHKIARIIYSMLKNQTEYVDPGAHFYDQQYRQRALKNLQRKAKKLGFSVGCQFSPASVPPFFGNSVPVFFGKDVPPVFGQSVPPVKVS
jgi:transposase